MARTGITSISRDHRAAANSAFVAAMFFTFSGILFVSRFAHEAGAKSNAPGGFMAYKNLSVPYLQARWESRRFEQTVTLSFITDVCFNFNTAYLDEDERWITDRAMIGQRYMSGWFWIDAPSSVPVELIDLFLEGDSSSLGMLKFLRLFRLLRLLRLLKLGEYISAIEIKFDLNLTFLRICQLIGAMCFLAHMLGAAHPPRICICSHERTHAHKRTPCTRTHVHAGKQLVHARTRGE